MPGAIGSIAGGLIGAFGSNKAGKAQANAANAAAQMQMQQYQQTRGDLKPYMQMGRNNINLLQSTLNKPFSFTAKDYQQSPGYQFAVNQGMRGINNSAISKGLGLSGAQLKGISGYNTGMAQQDFGNQRAFAQGNYQNRLQNLMGAVGMGQNAAAGAGQIGVNAANNAGNNMTSAGAAQGAGYMGMANSVVGGIDQYNQYNMLNNMFGPKQQAGNLFNNGQQWTNPDTGGQVY